MSTPSDKLNTVVSLIKSAVEDAADVSLEFTGNKQELPLKRVMISAGIKKTDIKYITDESAISFDKKIMIEALICAPKSESGENMFSLLDKIFSKMIEANGQSITLYAFSSSYIRYSSTIGALILPIYITVGF